MKACSLPFFSRDLVKIVYNYLVSRSAKPEAQPRLLFSFASATLTGEAMGLSIDDQDRVWCAGFKTVQCFSEDGAFLFKSPASFSAPLGVAFDSSSGEAFVTDFIDHSVALCRMDDGSFVRKFGKKGVSKDDSCGRKESCLTAREGCCLWPSLATTASPCSTAAAAVCALSEAARRCGAMATVNSMRRAVCA